MLSNWRPFLAVVVVIVLGWFAAMQSTSSGQNPARVVPTRWQYNFEVGNQLDESTANRLGIEGWEMVTFDKQPNDVYRVIYKRKS
jgi:hypothetical protein